MGEVTETVKRLKPADDLEVTLADIGPLSLSAGKPQAISSVCAVLAESEIITGPFTEYSGMKFGMFYAGELLHAFTFGGFWAILFFGGYRFFGLEQVSPFLAVAVILFKAMVGYWVIMWIKYTLLRIRIDHMLAFNWKFLTPLAFVLLMVTAFMNALLADAPGWLYISGMFLSNVLTAWIAMEIARTVSRRAEREVVAAHPMARMGRPEEVAAVVAACRAKGIDPASPLAGEEWLGGPMATMRCSALVM